MVDITDIPVPQMKADFIEVADHGPQERVQNHTEETVGVLKQLKDEMTADLDTDIDGKLNVRELLDDVEGLASLRDEFVNALKEAGKDGDGLLNQEGAPGRIARYRVSEQHGVRCEKRDPGFVDALDIDTGANAGCIARRYVRR